MTSGKTKTGQRTSGISIIPARVLTTQEHEGPIVSMILITEWHYRWGYCNEPLLALAFLGYQYGCRVKQEQTYRRSLFMQLLANGVLCIWQSKHNNNGLNRRKDRPASCITINATTLANSVICLSKYSESRMIKHIAFITGIWNLYIHL